MNRRIVVNKSVLLSDNSINPIVTDSVAMLRDAGYDECYIEKFADDAVSILNDYARLIGEGADKYEDGYEVGQTLRKQHIMMKNLIGD